MTFYPTAPEMTQTFTVLESVQTEHGELALVRRDATNHQWVDDKWAPYSWTDYGLREPFHRYAFTSLGQARERFNREVETFMHLGWVRS